MHSRLAEYAMTQASLPCSDVDSRDEHPPRLVLSDAGPLIIRWAAHGEDVESREQLLEACIGVARKGEDGLWQVEDG